MWTRLLAAFLLIGCIGFGGGYAVIPLMEKELSLRFHLLSLGDLSTLVTLAQVAPGPVAVNVATLAGYKVGGWVFALIATLALIIPPAIITILLVRLWERIRNNATARAFLDGLKPVVVALVLVAGISMASRSVHDLSTAVVLVISTLAAAHPRWNPLIVIVGAVVISAGYAVFRQGLLGI